MLNDTKLRALKPQKKPYKVTDRDGLYVYVSPSGTISFRYDYIINQRRETFTIGRYGIITLAQARARLLEAKALIDQGLSPAKEKRMKKTAGDTLAKFGVWFEHYIANADFVDSTRQLRLETYRREMTSFSLKSLTEITSLDIRLHCETIKDRGAPSTALLVRELFGATYRYAINKGIEVSNPTENIRASSIAVNKPRSRTLTPKEIGIFFNRLEKTESYFTLKKALKLILLTMVRKGELVFATWDEINFTDMIWTIPEDRMKAKRQHNVYLSRQALDILVAFKMFADRSEYVLPSRTDDNKPVSLASLNRVLNRTVDALNAEGVVFEPFTVHDLRRTASTLLHEQGFNTDWIEKALAHEQKGIRAVYNKAEYAEQRRDMMQQWADAVDGWL